MGIETVWKYFQLRAQLRKTRFFGSQQKIKERADARSFNDYRWITHFITLTSEGVVILRWYIPTGTSETFRTSWLEIIFFLWMILPWKSTNSINISRLLTADGSSKIIWECAGLGYAEKELERNPVLNGPFTEMQDVSFLRFASFPNFVKAHIW